MEITRTLTIDDCYAARALWQERFGDSDAFCDWYFAEQFTPELSAGVFLDGQLISMALGRPIALCEGGTNLPAAMIAGVSTRLGFERRGYMRRAMAHVEAQAEAAGFLRLALKPVNPAIYLPLGFLPYSAACLAFGTGNKPCPPVDPLSADPEALLACYDAATAGLAAYQRRTAAEMAARLRGVASDGGLCVAVMEDGQVRAYALLEDLNGDACEAVARTAEEYDALLDALSAGCCAMQLPDAPLGARIPHAMAKSIGAGGWIDPLGAAARFVPEEY